MTDLHDHNERAARYYLNAGKPCPNNLDCPQCAGDLWDTTPNMVLTVDPPRTPVHCPHCGYESTRVR